MAFWFRCIVSLALVLAGSAAHVSMEAGEPPAPPPEFTLEKAEPQDEAGFPFPEILEQLKEEWDRTFLGGGSSMEELVGRYGACGLGEACTLDYDGDGTLETFFTFGQYGGGIYPGVWLCFVDSAGKLTRVDETSFIDMKLLRYRDRTQICYTGGFATGLSFFGRIVGYQGGEVVKLLETHASDFQKEGPYLVTTPRVGPAGYIIVCVYRWDEAAETYRLVKPVEIDPEDLPEEVWKTAYQQDGRLTRAAKYAPPYYLLGFDDSKGERLLVVQRDPDGTCRAVSGYFPYEFDAVMTLFDAFVPNPQPVDGAPAPGENLREGP